MSEQIGPGAPCSTCGGEYGEHAEDCGKLRGMTTCSHDERFRGTFFAVNGCVACQLEATAASAAAWEETAKQFYRNEEFYRSIVTRIGELFGDESKTSDDGSMQQDVLALKVPELVEHLREKLTAVEAVIARLTADYPGGDQDAQARSWAAVWKALWDAGMDRFLGSTGCGRVRAVEFIRYLAADRERLLSQLPEGMKHCFIQFIECDKGHGRLTATNWVDHGCLKCEIDSLAVDLTRLTKNRLFR